MKKFIVLYHAPASAMNQNTNASPEDAAKGVEAWMNWAKKCGDHLVDMGSPLNNAGTTLKSDGSESTTSTINGYSVLQAADLNEAKLLLEKHPHIAWHPEASIELLETMAIPGM